MIKRGKAKGSYQAVFTNSFKYLIIALDVMPNNEVDGTISTGNTLNAYVKTGKNTGSVPTVFSVITHRK
ncbi:MAG: hypothetical protein D8M57_14455 [Candidatus Scalindua sp. AMX11]|nr:MAG: hypothetical protein DWQ00_09710 [Candidatus Scalindua sp.]TDE64202.1 MAG: hypothetical protein D8M57_14455 [Candidatus Scalindua sp. AMX11]GJQ59680.1 MAG: hypothetical protein SCALA701_24810 [Candidatus Scalindua sp.]